MCFKSATKKTGNKQGYSNAHDKKPKKTDTGSRHVKGKVINPHTTAGLLGATRRWCREPGERDGARRERGGQEGETGTGVGDGARRERETRPQESAAGHAARHITQR